MHWANEWVGIQHVKLGRDRLGYDCLGLFLAVYEARKGIKLNDPGCSMSDAIKQRIVDEKMADVVEVFRPDVIEGDALLFKTAGRPLHLGYALNKDDMLHSETTSSTIEQWSGTRWMGRLVGIYRHV